MKSHLGDSIYNRKKLIKPHIVVAITKDSLVKKSSSSTTGITNYLYSFTVASHNLVRGIRQLFFYLFDTI